MDSDSDSEEQAMAAAMGFSSFGTRPQKKRKYNPHADAAVVADSGLPQEVMEASSGSNSMPLGAPKRTQPTPAANADEIDLDDDDGEESESVTARPSVPIAESTEQENTALSRPAGLPERPAPGTGLIGFDNRSHGPQRGRQTAEAAKDPWYEGYYDSFSNQNPWDRLEKSLGLQSQGSWIARDVPGAPTSV